MKLRTWGLVGQRYPGGSKRFGQEWARLKACPISWTAVQKTLGLRHATGAGSPAGGVTMKELVKIAVP